IGQRGGRKLLAAVVIAGVVPAVDDDRVADVGHGDVAEGDVFHHAPTAAGLDRRRPGLEAQAVVGSVERDVVDVQPVEAGLGLAADGDPVAVPDRVVGDGDVGDEGSAGFGNDVIITGVDGGILDQDVLAGIVDGVGVGEVIAVLGDGEAVVDVDAVDGQ